MKKRLFVFLFIVLMILGLFICSYSKNVDDVINSYANNYVSNMLVKLLYESINEYLSEKGVEYFDIVRIEKDTNGNVETLTVNSGILNRIRSESTVILVDKLEKLSTKDFFIPLGNIVGSRLFSGVGPNIKIKIIPLGYVSSEMKNEFYSVGINQSKHNISIKYTLSLNVVAPFTSASTTHSSIVTIAESIIIGDIPNTNVTVGSGFNEEIKYYNRIN